MAPTNAYSAPLYLSKELVKLETLLEVKRAVVLWSRLELLPETDDLAVGLQAPLADPLWLIGRQWQFSEFQGEDAGTPVAVHLAGEAAHLTRYSPGGQGANPVDYQDLNLPLEVAVEREAVRAVHPRLAAEAGEHLLRLLAAAGVSGGRAGLRPEYALEIADEAMPHPQADPQGRIWQALFGGSALDGRRLAADLRALAAPDGSLAGLPAAFGFAAGLEAQAQTAAADWLRWYAQHVSEPDESVRSAWIPQRQEYAMTLAAQFSDATVNLRAAEYTDGNLDWYDFNAAAGPDLGQPAQAQPVEQIHPRPMIPAPARYPGMPADRYWEFEDARVSLGNLETGHTDLARLLLAEFALVFSNDWFVFPLELPVGSVFRVGSFNVHDTFGVISPVRPSRNLDGARWTMFLLSSQPGLPAGLQDLFFLPPTLSGRLEGEPLEEVALFRDEMANLAWGVEERVQGASGMALDRRMEPATPSTHQRINAADISAELIYRLMTPVPEPWLPFVPVPHPSLPLNQFAVDLERRTILRTQPDGSRLEVHPRGILLRTDLSLPVQDEPPLRLFEEEVPREGARVRRSFQYARWHTGGRFLWSGRAKHVGRGEGDSGLRFDTSPYAAALGSQLANQPQPDPRRKQPL